MKKATLITALFLLFLSACQKDNTQVSAHLQPVSDVTAAEARDPLALRATIAADPNLQAYLDEWVNLIQAMQYQNAAAMTPELLQALQTAASYAELQALLLGAGFNDPSEIIQHLENLQARIQALVAAYPELAGLSPAVRKQIIEGAWEDVTNRGDDPDGPGDCCNKYRKALEQCMSLAGAYIGITWTTILEGNVLGGILGAFSVFSVLDQIYACINTARAAYQPCCPENTSQG